MGVVSLMARTQNPLPKGTRLSCIPRPILRCYHLLGKQPHPLSFPLQTKHLFPPATIMSKLTYNQISGFTALPGINNKMSQGLLDGIFWVPQMVGGSGFIISGMLYMLETQPKWYVPAWEVLGWHIGFWNLIGAFGFTVPLPPLFFPNEGTKQW